MIYLSIIKLMMILSLDNYFIEITGIYILLLTYFMANAKNILIKLLAKISSNNNYKKMKG